jgi:hypothetical protein
MDAQAMRWEEVEVGEPKDGEIRVKNTAIGVNFIDVYFRKGVYPAPLPFTPGTAPLLCTSLPPSKHRLIKREFWTIPCSCSC